MKEQSTYIEEYINHQLTGEERSLFDERLNVDEAFARSVKDHSLLLSSFDEIKAQTLISGFKSIENEIQGGEERRLGFPVYLKWAASIAILAAVSLVILLNSNKSSTDLFLTYYAPYPNTVSPVSRSGNEGDLVWQQYESGNYLAAYEKFEKALITDETDIASRFYMGICALELSRLTVARESFSVIATDKNNTYSEQAQWYLALTNLKAENISEVKSGLNEIIRAKSGYRERAEALLEELD